MHLPSLLKQLAKRTGVMFLIFLAASILPLVLNFPPQFEAHFKQTFRVTTDELFHIVAVIAFFLQLIQWINALIDYWHGIYVERHKAEYGATTTIGAVAVMIRIVIVLLLLLMTLDSLGFHVTPLIAGLGIGGIAIAFALQNILSDLFGSLSIIFDKPFVIGDAIQVDQMSGRVERIGLKSTRVRADSGELIIFANSQLLTGRVRNFQLMQERRVVLPTRIVGDTLPDLISRVPQILQEIIEAQPDVRFDRSHLVGFGDSTIDFETVYFLTDPSYVTFMNTQQAVNLATMRRLNQEGITFSAQLEALVKEKAAGKI